VVIGSKNKASSFNDAEDMDGTGVDGEAEEREIDSNSLQNFGSKEQRQSHWPL